MTSGLSSGDASARQDYSSVMDDVLHDTKLEDHRYLPPNLDSTFENGRNDVSPDTLLVPDGTRPNSTSCLSPVIYTEYHFEDLKLGALHYAQDELKKHEQLGISIMQKDIELHWREQVSREYSNSHHTRKRLIKQVIRLNPLP